MRIRSLLTGIAVALAVTGGPASAQDAAGLTGTIAIELNRMEDTPNNGCRVFFVLNNDTDVTLTALQPDIYVFGADGVILRRMVFNAPPMPEGSQRAMALDLADQSCSGIGRKRRHRDHYHARTGNVAFDDWREAELKRLDEERRRLDEMREEFDGYVRELRRAKDQEEFDRFMRDRKNSAAGNNGNGDSNAGPSVPNVTDWS